MPDKVSPMPSKKFLDSLRWLLSESGQLLRLEASGTTFIRSLEGKQWCVGELDSDGIIADERCYSNIDDAIKDYVRLVSARHDW